MSVAFLEIISLLSNSFFQGCSNCNYRHLQFEYISKQCLLIINCNTRSLDEKMFRPINKESNWYSLLRDILDSQSPLLTLFENWILAHTESCLYFQVSNVISLCESFLKSELEHHHATISGAFD